MTNIERRLALLESRVRNVEARLKISEPDRPKFGSKHVGSKSKEVLIQEGFSLQNQYKPKTMTPNEHAAWMKTYEEWHQAILSLDDKRISEIEAKIKEMLNPL